MGSIPDDVIELHNPSDRCMALDLTKLLGETSTRNISWGVKAAGARADNLTTLCASRLVKLLEPSGPVKAYTGIGFYSLQIELSFLSCLLSTYSL